MVAVFSVIANAFRPKALYAPISGASSVTGLPYGSSQVTYGRAVAAYMTNEIVAAGLNLLSLSASEPHIIGKRYRRNKRGGVTGWSNESVNLDIARLQTKAETRYLKGIGVMNRPNMMEADARLVRNGFWEEVDNHPLIVLLNAPNPYTSRGQFWTQIVLDYYLAGNAYALKARYATGMLEGAVAELWRLRPDRMKPIPGDMTKGEPFIKEYEYSVDGKKIPIPASDVMHFKHTNPLNPYEGITPLTALLPRVDIDSKMRTFLFNFFDHGGAGVGASLNIKNATKMTQEEKDDIRNRFKRLFSGGQYDVLVSTAEDITYTPFSLNRGLRDALPQEIDAVTEARISMVLKIQGPILGLLISYDNASYASHRIAYQMFWDGTMTPLLSDFDDVLNLSLVPEFGGIDEVCFDLSDIRALQEDVEALQERARKNVAARIWTWEEGRVRTGVGDAQPDEHVLLPDGSAVKVSEIDTTAPVQEPAQLPAPAAVALLPARTAGRPRVEDDDAARGIYDEAMALKGRNPGLTWNQVAARVGVTDRTLRNYRVVFDDDEE